MMLRPAHNFLYKKARDGLPETHFTARFPRVFNLILKSKATKNGRVYYATAIKDNYVCVS